MANAFVVIEINGEISVGELIKGQAQIGETVTIKLHNENGMPLVQSGVVIETLID